MTSTHPNHTVVITINCADSQSRITVSADQWLAAMPIILVHLSRGINAALMAAYKNQPINLEESLPPSVVATQPVQDILPEPVDPATLVNA